MTALRHALLSPITFVRTQSTSTEMKIRGRPSHVVGRYIPISVEFKRWVLRVGQNYLEGRFVHLFKSCNIALTSTVESAPFTD